MPATAAPRARRDAGVLIVAWLALLVAGCAVGLVLRHHDPSVDFTVLRDLHGPRSGAVVATVRALRVAGEAPVLDIVFAVVAVLLLVARRGRELAFLVLASPGAAVLIVAIKAIVVRPRPPVVHLAPFTGSSWPSADAGDTLALLAAVAVLAHRAWPGRSRAWSVGVLATLLALAVGVERVYLGVHYPTDVLGGWLIAAVWIAALRRTMLRATPA